MSNVSAEVVGGLDMPGIIQNSKSAYDCKVVTTKNSYYIQVNKGEKINFGVKTDSITNMTWNFGDNTKEVFTKPTKDYVSTSHKFNKNGMYTVKLVYNGQKGGISLSSSSEEFVKVKVVTKPDLTLTGLVRNVDGKKNVVSVLFTVKNKGAASAKASKLQVAYNDPKYNAAKYSNKGLVKIYSKLKKYTKTVKVKALKSGRSTKVLVNFKIPVKYRNLVKFVRIIPNKKSVESISSNNLVRFV
ncbi:PKD domain-containing protein [Methanobrevibacter filiformis]|nr:PKD domain-containing protein [Methanobrevibacter filiformis]